MVWRLGRFVAAMCMPTGLTQPCSLVQASFPKHLALYRHPMRLSGAVSACFIYFMFGYPCAYRHSCHDSDLCPSNLPMATRDNVCISALLA